MYQPKKEEIREMFKIQDDAKRINLYQIANIVWAWLFAAARQNYSLVCSYEHDGQRYRNADEIIESIRASGAGCELYRDLLVITFPRKKHGNEDKEEDWEECYACLPLPLLTLQAAEQFVLRVETRCIQPRHNHNRRQHEAEEHEAKEIFDRLFAIITPDEVVDLCQIFSNSPLALMAAA